MNTNTIILFIICAMVVLWVFAVFLKGSPISRFFVSFYAVFVVGFSGVFLGHPEYVLYVAMIFSCVISPAIVASVVRWLINRNKRKALEASQVNLEE